MKIKSLRNNSKNPNINKADENSDKLFELKFTDFQHNVLSENFGKEVYIITEEYKVGKNSLYQSKYFKIHSTLNHVKNLFGKKIEFYLVNKEFLEKNRIAPNEYVEKEVIFYESKNKKFLIFPKEKNNNNILEIKKKILENKDNNNKEELIPFPKENINEEKYVENNEMILKKLILLYAFEKQFLQLMKLPIKDEFEVNEYYLINKNLIDNYYKIDIYQKYILPLLNDIQKQLDYPLSYKGYFINIENIINYLTKETNISVYINEIVKLININNDVISNEENFIPKFNEKEIGVGEKAQYPIEFILVPEKIFDLYFKGIKASKHQKDDYKFNTLIGSNVLFIQNKKYNNKFNSYLLSENSNRLEMSYQFIYNETKKFYHEVREFIKGKDFINYIIERQLEYNKLSTYLELLEKDSKIGSYINFNPFLCDIIKKYKTKQCFYKCQNIYSTYEEIIPNLLKLKDKNIFLSNDINNMNNFDFYPIFIVIGENWKEYEKLLLFDHMKTLSQDKNKEQSENTFIQKLLNNHNNLDFKSLSNYIKKSLTIIDQMTIDNYSKNINSFSLLSKDILLKINNDKDFIDFLEKQEEFLFLINNKEYIKQTNNSPLKFLTFKDV